MHFNELIMFSATACKFQLIIYFIWILFGAVILQNKSRVISNND